MRRVCLPLTALGLILGQAVGAEDDGNTLIGRARQEWESGRHHSSIRLYESAARQYRSKGKPQQQCEALILLANAYQSSGDSSRARSTLSSALRVARNSANAEMRAIAAAKLAELYATDRDFATAKTLLDEARSSAPGSTPRATAYLAGAEGVQSFSTGDYSSAANVFNIAADRALEASEFELAVQARTNSGLSMIRAGDTRTASTLKSALEEAKRLRSSMERLRNLIAVGAAYIELAQTAQGAEQNAAMAGAREALSVAATGARDIADPVLRSYLYGYLGRLATQQGQLETALELTRRAVLEAGRATSASPLYLWQWQTAKLLRQIGHVEEAISVYRRARDTAHEGRSTSATGYSPGFRASVSELYIELADLLLTKATSLPEGEARQADLTDVIQTMELLKASELQNYFRDQCIPVPAKRFLLDGFPKDSAVLYPIVLPSRLEVVLAVDGKLHVSSSAVSSTEIAAQVRTLRQFLEKRTTHEYLPYSQRVYEWLLRPFEPLLSASGVNRLIFVPDGHLRIVPLSALHDGREFLVERFSVATTPGLTWVEPSSGPNGAPDVLSAGITRAVQDFASLPYVEDELSAIRKLYPGKLLLDERFDYSRFSAEVDRGDFRILHIASHGKFADSVDNSYVLTFNEKLTIDRFTRLIAQASQHRRRGDLLVLSACETAAGDDQAMLGLAGMAMRAGMPRVVASIWAVDDAASAQLITDFYREMKRSSRTPVAEALRRAQQRMIDGNLYMLRHPGYWAPFLLIDGSM